MIIERFCERLLGGATAVALIFMLLLVWFGCAPSSTAIRRERIYDTAIPSAVVPYLLGPGDRLDLSFILQQKIADTAEYRFEIGDELHISFYSNSEMNQKLSIPSDGYITLPPVGRILAAGKSIKELTDTIVSLFRPIIPDPLVFVTPISNQRSTALLIETLLLSAERTKGLVVGPDGLVALPFCDTVNAVGITVAKFDSITKARYAACYPGVSVSVRLVEAVNNNVFIFGEVSQGGAYSLDGAPTLTQALARARVVMDLAGLRSVVVLSRTDDGRPVQRIVNVRAILHSGNISLDPILRQYDVVFVPKKPIAKVDLFVRQYINELIPQVFRPVIYWSIPFPVPSSP